MMDLVVEYSLLNMNLLPHRTTRPIILHISMDITPSLTIYSLPPEVLAYILTRPLIYVNRLSVNWALTRCIIHVCKLWYVCVRANATSFIDIYGGVSRVATYFRQLPAACFSGLTLAQKIALANEPEILSNDGRLLAKLAPQYRVAWGVVFEHAFTASIGLPRYEIMAGSAMYLSSPSSYHCNAMYIYEQYRRYVYEYLSCDLVNRLIGVYIPARGGIHARDYNQLYDALWYYMVETPCGQYHNHTQRARGEYRRLLAALQCGQMG